LQHESKPDRIGEWFKRNGSFIALAVVAVFVLLPRISPWDGLNDNLNVVSRLSGWMIGRLETLFHDYGYIVVFFGVLVENAMFLGLLVPGAVILMLAGLSAENGSINIWVVFGLAWIATIIGDTISYMIGRLGWTKFLDRTGMGEMMEKVREPMEQHSSWIILAYHMAGYSRVVGPAAAGLFHIPYRKWAPLDYAGGLIWVLSYTALGYILGTAGLEFGDTKSMVRFLEWFFLGLFAIAIVLAYVRAKRNGGGGEPRRPATVVVPVDRDE